MTCIVTSSLLLFHSTSHLGYRDGKADRERLRSGELGWLLLENIIRCLGKLISLEKLNRIYRYVVGSKLLCSVCGQALVQAILSNKDNGYDNVLLDTSYCTLQGRC